MKPSFTPSQISYSDYIKSVENYPQYVPEKTQPLEPIRYSDIPETIVERRTAGEAFLEKAELQSLVEWKLKFGTFRPSLSKLVGSNPAAEVRKQTSSAFSTYVSAPFPVHKKAIATLCTLKGIGPATASLILSCYDPETVPFFSDELFRWLHWEEEDDDDDDESVNLSKKRRKKIQGEGQGWERKIKYTAKEYESVFEKTTQLRERLEEESGKAVRAVDVERAAFAISKRDGLGLLEGVGEGDGEISGGKIKEDDDAAAATPRDAASVEDDNPKQRRRSKRRKV